MLVEAGRAALTIIACSAGLVGISLLAWLGTSSREERRAAGREVSAVVWLVLWGALAAGAIITLLQAAGGGRVSF